jgi:hypothetical protein
MIMFNSLFSLYLLPIIIFLPLFVAVFILLFISNKNIQFTRQIGSFFFLLLLSYLFFCGLVLTETMFASNLFMILFGFLSTNLYYSLAIHGISIFLVIRSFFSLVFYLDNLIFSPFHSEFPYFSFNTKFSAKFRFEKNL